MSFRKQQKDFQAQMASAASKFAKRTLPNGLGSAMSSAKTTHVSTPEPISKSRIVYSQPADTGKGQNIQTQVLYARDHLKEKGTELSLDDLLGYLSQQNAEKAFKDALATILRKHPQVDFDRAGLNGRGSYKFRPKHAIRNGTDLLAVLQSHSTFKGLPVKELKEGWHDAEAGITALEKEHKIIAIRNKKDNTARTVWEDDPTMHNAIDAGVREMARMAKPLDEQGVIDTLVQQGQQPTGQVNKKAKTGPTKVEKKVKKPRRGGKTTNKHMVGILKDFSHLRR